MRQIKLKSDEVQLELLCLRASRVFLKCHDENHIVWQLNNASDIVEVEQIAMQNGVCDYCSLVDLNLESAVTLVRIATHISFLFPKIRSRMCFLGSKAGYRNALRSLCLLDREIIKKFRIQHICSDKAIINMSSDVLIMIDNVNYDGKKDNVLAQAFTIRGLLDAIILDESDFRGLNYRRLTNQLKDYVAFGCYPKGCDTVDALIYHEFGHLLDALVGLSENEAFISYYNSFDKLQIAKNLSQYATINIREFFAEAFSEYMCNKNPRSIAVYAGKFLEKLYQEAI